MVNRGESVFQFLRRKDNDILGEWVKGQLSEGVLRRELIRESELQEQCREFFARFLEACNSGNLSDIWAPEWHGLREFLTGISRSRAIMGFTPTETGMFIFSLKRPIFTQISREPGFSIEEQRDLIWTVTEILDKLGLFTAEVYLKGREEVIGRQQQEMLELSTPVVKLWDGILALPMIGTLDSSRTQIVMETLLQRIVETSSRIAIIDITGVPMVDTLVAQHLMKTVAAARLMGADCIISGIRPQIAQTIVHLAVDLGTISTKASLSDAFVLALQKLGHGVVRNSVTK